MVSTKPNTFFQLKGYPGLKNMAEYIKPLIPASKIYVEPFAGLGRTVEIDKHETIILNDKSEEAYNYLEKKFGKYVDSLKVSIYQVDYKLVIAMYIHNPDAFLFIDPPWRKNIYKNNKGPVFTEKNIITYYENILKMLKNAKCKWILTVDRDEHELGKRVTNCGYTNKVIQHPKVKLFGKPIAVRMASNMW